MTPLDQRLDVLRGEAITHFGALVLQSEVAALYVQLGSDDRLMTVIDDAAERARALVRLKHKLTEARRDAALTAEAAVEFRAERKSTLNGRASPAEART